MRSSECRQYARQCIELASKARPEYRERLLEMAQKWDEIADEKARQESRQPGGSAADAAT